MMINNDAFIFTGPSLSPEEAVSVLKGVYLPPAKQGDIYRIVKLFSPQAIGIIDGYFNQVPAVWHKEILWAMDQGVTVYGASSMGALRAAELDVFGMVGCGKIYEAFQAGVLPPFFDEVFEDDDEVAVVHGPAELGYPSMSDAMVNIRFTMAYALNQKVLDHECFNALTKAAKSLFYPQRSHNKIIDLATQTLGCKEALTNYKEWIVSNTVDQKKLDAFTMLKRISTDVGSLNKLDLQKKFSFENTSQWQAAREEIHEVNSERNPIVNELRLQGRPYFQYLQSVIEAPLSYSTNSLTDAASLSELHRDPKQLQQRLIACFSAMKSKLAIEHLPNSIIEYELLSCVIKSGDYLELETRVKDKQLKLNKIKNKPDIGSLGEVDLLQLCDWYFSHCLDQDMPDDVNGYAQKLGVDGLDQFYTIIFDEYLYLDAIA